MNKKYKVVAAMFATAVALGACADKSAQVDGYRLIEKRFVAEVNSEAYYYEHIKSGGHVLKLANDDQNKTFAAAFITEPNSDCGTPHIIEHAVLNGSKNFPIKSPFDQMGRTSLRTFLNAFTSQDWTAYPVASMNDKDFTNLMTVYLDAVFFPRILEDERIFMQEGWHYELEDASAPITLKGVVYNEMKGNFSSPSTELFYQIRKALFPDNGYGKSSGGHPQAIPELTYEDFKAFYREHYHPSNGLIVVYGDGDLRQELELIDRQYLSTFDRGEGTKKIEPQAPFDEFKRVDAPYPVLPGAPTEGQSYLALNWVYGDGTRDQDAALALDILTEVLVNQESAPVRLALQEAGIGKDMSAYCNPSLQNQISLLVMNADASQAEQFREIVEREFRKAAQEGVDRDAVEAYLNRMEFRLREGDDNQKGLSAMLSSFNEWMFSRDPFRGMEWEKDLASIKKLVAGRYLEEILTKALIDNTFGALVVLSPEPGLEEKINAETTRKLAEYKKSLTAEQIDKLVADTKALVEYQQSEDSPEALATIPKLTREDLNPEVNWYELTPKSIDGIEVLHYDDFTNGIVYTTLMFDLRVLPVEQLPYAKLLASLLGSLDTEARSFGDLEKEINKNTGSLRTDVQIRTEERDQNRPRPYFAVETKAVAEKTGVAFDLIGEILFKSSFADTDRLGTLLQREFANQDYRVKSNGYQVAAIRAGSYLSKAGLLAERTHGLDYYQFVRDIAQRYAQDPAAVVEQLAKVGQNLFTRANLIAAVGCDATDYETYSKAFGAFAANLPAGQPASASWNVEPKAKNEALATASKVQYVVQTANIYDLGYKWDGRLNVLDNILSGEYLQNTVRVQGGAYGGFSNITRTGAISFGSYRDPNLEKTFDNYRGAVEYLKNFEADEERMLGFIIGTMGGFDQPLTPSIKYRTAVGRHFDKMTRERLQAERDQVLATTADDIRGYAKMVEDFLNQQIYCVYGGTDKINSNKKLFKEVLTIQ